jgi:hypothetical protein
MEIVFEEPRHHDWLGLHISRLFLFVSYKKNMQPICLVGPNSRRGSCRGSRALPILLTSLNRMELGLESKPFKSAPLELGNKGTQLFSVLQQVKRYWQSTV